MAPAFVNFTLPASVLVSVIITGLPDLNITNPSRSFIESPQQSQLATLPDDYVAYPDSGAAYKVYNESVTWIEARRQCISEGAHLADIDTQSKFEYLMTQSQLQWAWTGVHKMHGDEEWASSSTGLTMATLPWADGEPSGDHNCVHASESRGGLLNNDCNLKLSYICELPIPENYNS